MNTFIFTCGDINGIGPEIIVKALGQIHETRNTKFIIISPASVFEDTYYSLGAGFPYKVTRKIHREDKEQIIVLDLGAARQKYGEPTKTSGRISYKAILRSFEFVNTGIADAVITAPISKLAFSLAEVDFPGHTELYARLSGTRDFMMMFVSQKLKCGLLTIHEPILKVPSLIIRERLEEALDLMVMTFRRDFLIETPSIAVLGLNPHAGENGRIGTEEEQVIKPVIFSSRYSRFISGPYVPDAFFGQHLYKQFDVVLGMYHDQVLIPFKMLDFSGGVNYTAGLPFVRTSPDHGTAFNIAGQNKADAASIIEAFKLARRIVKNRKKQPGFSGSD